jgi:hypothetical protein
MDAQIMKPRILVLTKLFWPEGSSGELATYLIVKNILSRHFDVFVVSGTRKPEADILRLAEYIHWSALETKYKPIEWLKLFADTYWLRRLIEEADIVYIPSHTDGNCCETLEAKRQSYTTPAQLPSTYLHFCSPCRQKTRFGHGHYCRIRRT